MKASTLFSSSIMLIVMLLIIQPASAENKQLSLVTAAQLPLGSNKDFTGLLEKIYKEAFARIGYRVTVTILPGERALINTNSGIDDGDMFRAPGFEKNYPNLIRVPESVGVMEFMAYSNKHEHAAMSWSDLESHSVAYATGWKIYERKVKAREITRVRKIHDLFPLLNNNRTDIILMDRWQGLYVAKQGGYTAQPIEPPLATVEMYLYLHKKHKDIIPALTKALQQMKNDGSYQKIYDRMSKELSLSK